MTRSLRRLLPLAILLLAVSCGSNSTTTESEPAPGATSAQDAAPEAASGEDVPETACGWTCWREGRQAATAIDVCSVLPSATIAEVLGVAINDTARLFGDNDPRACAYYRDDAETDLGYAASVITAPDFGPTVFDARCTDPDAVAVERGDGACRTSGGNDLVVKRGDGYVEVAIDILTVDLADETAYAAAVVAIYDALEPSL